MSTIKGWAGTREQRLATLGTKVLLRLTAALPDGLRSRLGGMLGMLVMVLIGKTRRVVDINLAISFPPLVCGPAPPAAVAKF